MPIADMHNFILIGLTGKAGSGKDTVADYLVEKYGFKKMSFAQPLKAALSAMGFPEPADRDRKEAPIDGFAFSWRKAAQTLGTEWGRSLDPDLWSKLLKQRIELAMSNVVVSDVRFENEAAMIRAMRGTIIHIEGRKASLGDRSNHASELSIELHEDDFIIDNSGSKAYLFNQINELMDRIYE